jgi:hypothetical protein
MEEFLNKNDLNSLKNEKVHLVSQTSQVAPELGTAQPQLVL